LFAQPHESSLPPPSHNAVHAMKNILGLTLVTASLCLASLPAQQAPQIRTGRISDSMCGASHQPKAGASTDRECMFECLKSLARYVLVDQNNKVIPLANQDLAGLPLYAGRMVRLTGELTDVALVVSRIEAIPPHLHIGHVMTNWRDTPGGVGFLIAALTDARVAAVHARLAGMDPGSLGDMKLHAGHVLNALDPGVEPKGPASGYGVKKAAAAALQHLDFAASAEGASVNVKTHATHVSASLGDAIQWTDQAIAAAEKIRAATSAADAASLVKDLILLTTHIVDGVDANNDGQIGWQTGEGGLTQARAHMAIMMKGEGLENAPR
jgi:hypothetical protein